MLCEVMLEEIIDDVLVYAAVISCGICSLQLQSIS